MSTLNRPGGNLTGVTTLGADLVIKRMELLHQLLPSATNLAVLIDPTTLTAAQLVRDLNTTAQSLSVELHLLRASSAPEIESAFAMLEQIGARGLVIGPGAFLLSRSEQLAAGAIKLRVPTIFDGRRFAEAGGLMTYGASPADLYHQVGVYAGRILKGEKPGDLPVQRSTRVELLLNLKSALVFESPSRSRSSAAPTRSSNRDHLLRLPTPLMAQSVSAAFFCLPTSSGGRTFYELRAKRLDPEIAPGCQSCGRQPESRPS